MTPETAIPTDRASFSRALAAVRAEHVLLRRLVKTVIERADYSADETLSLVEAASTHERKEATLFSLPFLGRPSEAVTRSAALSHRRCDEYVSGDADLPSARTAAALFVEALLCHIAAEEAWLAREDEGQKERLKIAA
jgi:hypothetical protein